MTIHQLEAPKASDIAKALDIAAPTVSQALKTLIKKEWIKINADKSFELTKNALGVTLQIEKNKALFMDLFVNILGVDKSLADQDSCKIEHLISPETGEALEKFLHNQHNETSKKSSLPVLN